MTAPPRAASALELRASILAGEQSAAAVVDRALSRIAARDGAVGAFLWVAGERARRRAEELDRALARGVAPGPLFGVPVALKDNLCWRGSPTTAGSRILEGWIAPFDATAVARLEAAGAVIVGKTNCDEFGMGSSTENSAYRPTRNPFATDRVPGGSSGGSAAAVAADCVPLALGSDTGGSIRQPAAFCGVVGFKPGYGRVSRHGLIAYASSLDQVGPLARTVADAAACHLAIAGPDPLDSTALRAPVDAPKLDGELAGRRIGVHRDYLDALPDAALRAAIERGLAHLEAAGAELVRIDGADLLTRHAIAVYYLIATAEASANLARFDGMRYGPRVDAGGLAPTYRATRGAKFGREVKRRILLGTFALSAGYQDAWYRKAQALRAKLRAAYVAAFREHRLDAIAGAVSPVPPFALGERSDDPLTMYLADALTVPASLAGLPALSVPCGFGAVGATDLPIGFQVIGPPLRDAAVLDVGHALELRAGVARRLPALAEAAP